MPLGQLLVQTLRRDIVEAYAPHPAPTANRALELHLLGLRNDIIATNVNARWRSGKNGVGGDSQDRSTPDPRQ